MTQIISLFIDIISKLHTKIMGLNDNTMIMSDKALHFIVIGLFGFFMLLIVQPIFEWLRKHDKTILISFIYVFTVVLVVSFAIEIGQAYSGSGDMDKYDIAFGVVGFFTFFAIYLFGYIWKKRLEQNEKKDKQ